LYVNIVAEHINAKRTTIIARFYTELNQTDLNCSSTSKPRACAGGNGHLTPLEIGTKNQIL